VTLHALDGVALPELLDQQPWFDLAAAFAAQAIDHQFQSVFGQGGQTSIITPHGAEANRVAPAESAHMMMAKNVRRVPRNGRLGGNVTRGE